MCKNHCSHLVVHVPVTSFSKSHISTTIRQKAFIFGHRYPGGSAFILWLLTPGSMPQGGIDSWVMIWRSAWPIFHSPVILPYILKTIWGMNIILWNYESVWPQNKCRSLWPIFHSPWFCLIHVSWSLLDVWTSYFGIMSQYNPRFDLKINVGHCDLYFMVQWFCLILKTIWWMNIILWDYMSVWPDVWPQNIFKSLWPYISWSSDFAW